MHITPRREILFSVVVLPQITLYDDLKKRSFVENFVDLSDEMKVRLRARGEELRKATELEYTAAEPWVALGARLQGRGDFIEISMKIL